MTEKKHVYRAESQRRYLKKQKENGVIRRNYTAHRDDHPKIKAFVDQLKAKRQGEP